MPSTKASPNSQARNGEGGGTLVFSSDHRLGDRRPLFPSLRSIKINRPGNQRTHRKRAARARISIAVQISKRYSSFGVLSRSLIGQENNASQTTRTDDTGKVCVSKGASQRLRRCQSRWRMALVNALRIMRKSWIQAFGMLE